MNKGERARAIEMLKGFLTDRSSIVCANALESLSDLATDPANAEDVHELIRRFTKTGTPALRARARILLARLSKH